jgi:hypothetical protein
MATLYKNKFSKEALEQLSLQARYFYDEADDGKQEKGKVYRDSYMSYKALIPNIMSPHGASIDASARLPVEPVIRKATNQVLATVKNTLLSDQIHSFIYRSKKEEIRQEIACSITERVNDILLRENDGDKIFTEAFREAIITGDSFVKFFIEEDKLTRKGSIDEPQPLPLAEVTTECGKTYSLAKALEKFPDTLLEGDVNLTFTTRTVDIDSEIVIPVEAREVVEAMADERDINVTFGEESTTVSLDVVYVSGDIELVKIDKNIIIEFVPFQDIYVDRYLQDTDISKADYICHRIPMTRYKAYQLYKDAGIEALELLQNIDTNVDYPYSNFKMNTQNAMTDGYEQTRSAADDMLNNVFIYEHYFTFKCPVTKEYELMQVCTATHDGQGILSIEKVKCLPFVHYSAFPMNTAFWSESIHDYLYDEQVRQTTLSRSVSKYAEHGATLRFLADSGMSPDSKRALIDNRAGGVVFVDDPSDVIPMPTHQISKAVITGLELSKESVREEWSSTVGQDIIDNGSNMSATAASLSVGQFEMKDKAICKNLAVGHTKLAMGILSLLSEDQQSVTVKMNYSEGEQAQAQELGIELQPYIEYELEDLDLKGDFIPDVNTPNDLAQQAQALVQSNLLAMQIAPSLITPHGVYQALDKVLEAAAVYNTDSYFNEPNTAPLATNEQILEMQTQLETMAQAMTQAQVNNLEAEAQHRAAQAAGKVLENRQYQIDKKLEHDTEKAKLAMESQELRGDLRSQAIDDVLDILSYRLNVQRTELEFMLSAEHGKDFKLGSYARG